MRSLSMLATRFARCWNLAAGLFLSVYMASGEPQPAQPSEEQLRRANVHHSLGALLHYKGDLLKAERYYRLALESREALLGPTHLDTAQTAAHLGLLYHHLGHRGIR